MIVTEVEARTKWCPKSMASDAAEGTGQSYNRLWSENRTIIPAECRCVGSSCMWWVWLRANDKEAVGRMGSCGPAIR